MEEAEEVFQRFNLNYIHFEGEEKFVVQGYECEAKFEFWPKTGFWRGFHGNRKLYPSKTPEDFVRRFVLGTCYCRQCRANH